MNKHKKHRCKTHIKIQTDNILFFDMDGTLIDTDFANFLSYREAVKSVIQISNCIFNPLKERFNNESLRKLIPNLTESEYKEITQLKEEIYSGYLSKTKINKPIANILTQHYKTNRSILVTNSDKNRAIMTLEYHGLFNMFSNYFFKQTQEKNKFKNAIQKLEISPKLVIAFENEDSEIANAIEANIQFINPIIICER